MPRLACPADRRPDNSTPAAGSYCSTMTARIFVASSTPPAATSTRASTACASCKSDCSHHLALAQIGDLVIGKAELGQHFLGLLAEFRRTHRHPARRARQCNGLANQLDVAVL